MPMREYVETRKQKYRECPAQNCRRNLDNEHKANLSDAAVELDER
jgi:hypothetical protein